MTISPVLQVNANSHSETAAEALLEIAEQPLRDIPGAEPAFK